MMDQDEVTRAAKRATDKLTKQQTAAARSAAQADQLTTSGGLKIVRNNWLPPSAAHQPMRYQPKE